MHSNSGLHRQFLYTVFERPSKMSARVCWARAIVRNATTFGKTQSNPDEHDSNGAEGGAARAGPASMRSCLPCCVFNSKKGEIKEMKKKTPLGGVGCDRDEIVYIVFTGEYTPPCSI